MAGNILYIKTNRDRETETEREADKHRIDNIGNKKKSLNTGITGVKA